MNLSLIPCLMYLLLLSACGNSKPEESGQAEETVVKSTEQEPAPAPETSVAPNAWSTLDKPGFSIRYPGNWQMQTSENPQVALILMSPQENDSDLFRENINLLVQDLNGLNMDLNSYTKLSESQISQALKKAKIDLSKRLFDPQGNEYHKLIYSGEQGGYHLKFEQLYRLHNNKAWVLTYTAVLDDFERFRKTGEAIMESLIIK